MPKTLYIVGTDHKYQNRSDEFTDDQHAGFERYISQIITESEIALLAEENNEQAVLERGLAESSIQKLSRAHQIQHLFCELDRKTRAENGMEQENGIRLSGFFNNWTPEGIESKIQESYRNREAYWLKLIVERDVWPALFICGANHALPFQELVSKNHIIPVLLSQDWSN